MYLKYVFIVFLVISITCCTDKSNPRNIGELPSGNFKIEVGGEPVFVYQARVSKYLLIRTGLDINDLWNKRKSHLLLHSIMKPARP